MTTLPIADCHNDLLLHVLHLRERGHSDPFGAFWLPQLRSGNVRLQVLPICTEEQFVGEAAIRRCFLMVEEAYHLARVHDADVAIVTSRQELESSLEAGKIALVLALEGAEPVGHQIQILGTMFRAGIRMVSLTWNRRTMFADGVGEHDAGGRLTQLGIEAVAEIERLGMALDVSHLSEPGFWHVVDIATKPFLASHSSCRALQNHVRNLHDEQLQAIAAAGGVIGINAFGPFLADQPTTHSYLDHIAHATATIGADAVALGPDFIDDVAATVDPILTGLLIDPQELPVVEGLSRPADLAGMARLMVERLGAEISEKVAYSNLIAFLRSVLPS